LVICSCNEDGGDGGGGGGGGGEGILDIRRVWMKNTQQRQGIEGGRRDEGGEGMTKIDYYQFTGECI